MSIFAVSYELKLNLSIYSIFLFVLEQDFLPTIPFFQDCHITFSAFLLLLTEKELKQQSKFRIPGQRSESSKKGTCCEVLPRNALK